LRQREGKKNAKEQRLSNNMARNRHARKDGERSINEELRNI
jgi:hypothetical protein